MKRPHRYLMVAVAVVVAAILGVAAFAGTPRTEGGPMIVPDPHGWATSDAGVGDVFTDGSEILDLAGDQNAVIEDIRLVGDEGLELVGAKIVGGDRKIGAIQYNKDFPPTNEPELDDAVFYDAVGATITPEAVNPGGWELLLGIKATEEGNLVREAIEVDYRVGEEKYTVSWEALLGVCTSPEYEVDGKCPLPGLDS